MKQIILVRKGLTIDTETLTKEVAQLSITAVLNQFMVNQVDKTLEVALPHPLHGWYNYGGETTILGVSDGDILQKYYQTAKAAKMPCAINDDDSVAVMGPVDDKLASMFTAGLNPYEF